MKKTYVELMACAGLLALAACSDSDKMAGVTEDDNALAQLSSSSLADSLSSSSPTLSSSGMGATPKFDLWNGVDGIAKVNTGNENLGYWYSFGDDAEGGMSLVKYPVELGNEYSGNSLEPVIEACEEFPVNRNNTACTCFDASSPESTGPVWAAGLAAHSGILKSLHLAQRVTTLPADISVLNVDAFLIVLGNVT